MKHVLGSVTRDREVAARFRQLGLLLAFAALATTLALGVSSASGAALPLGSCANEALRSENNSLLLPDCRAYEMVSPIDKARGDIVGVLDAGQYASEENLAALDGNSFTYTSFRAFGNAVAAPLASQYLATRGPGGWATQALNPPREGAGFYGTGFSENEFKAFTPDLCHAWFIQDSEHHVSPVETPDRPNLVKRTNCPNSYEGFEALPPLPDLENQNFTFDLEGRAADGSAAVFRTGAKLTPDASDNRLQTYEARNGELKFVCIFPPGTDPAVEAYFPNCSAGMPSSSLSPNRTGGVIHAMSEDGSRIYWTASAETPNNVDPGPLYLRIDGSTTKKVSETITPAAARFYRATPDGGKALFRVESDPRTGEQSPPHSRELIEYDLATESSEVIAGEVLGVAATSDDFSRIYFVSEESIAGEGVSGEPNLFLRESGSGADTFTLIATLVPRDVGLGYLGQQGPSNISTYNIDHVAATNQDGSRLSFISVKSLTGFDNRDSVTGEPDFEVFTYDAEQQLLNCVSCSPDGSRPLGRMLKFHQQATVPPSPTAAMLTAGTNQLYSARAMSEDGNRLFFTAYASLLPGDPEETADVYEWQAVGTGTCTDTSVPAYQPENGGCLYRLSSGSGDSELLDSDPTGRDVYFRTGESLIPQDPGSVDIYSARSGGGFPQPIQGSQCQGESCQPAASPPAFSPPASTVLQSGNPPLRKCRKGTHRIKKHGKVRCIKRHRQGHRRNRRIAIKSDAWTPSASRQHASERTGR